MSMLARYKKSPGQIIELVKLIEESAEPKRSQLLTMIRGEDPEFAARVEARILSMNDLRTINPDILAEIISATPAKHVALALHGDPNPDFVKIVERCLGNKFAEYKEEITNFESDPPNESKVEAGQRKMISEARKLEKAGAIKLPSRDSGEMPMSDTSSSPSAAAAPAPGASAPAAGTEASSPAALSSAGGPIPSVESFGFEAPPPGMSGERFETFVKKLLS
ncbi:MAG TPA: FliG C-terminal domain-containing protein [Bdellovibrionota bacterium]|nr:FliG C-terminal domain-containing protein [Bdellovibrionota bacterium]